MTDNKRLIKLRSLRNKLITLGISDEVNNLEEMFPELKIDSIDEDENTKNELFKHLKEGAEGYEPAGSSEDYAKWLDWLEKQFKQIHYTSDAPIGQTTTGEVVYIEDVKSTKPNFERGCWITNGRYVKLIVGIGTKDDMPYYYMFKDGTTKYIDEIDKKWHLWTIADVKCGDIVVTDKIPGHPSPFIAIFKEIGKDPDTFNSCCFIDFDGNFNEGDIGHALSNLHPATKEQYDTFFTKMKESGYEWDSGKKELKKSEDERISEDEMISKEIIKYLEQTVPHHHRDELLKSKEWIAWIEKQCKQNIKWSEENNERIEQICDDLKCGLENFRSGKNVKGLHFEEIIKYNINWLKSLKDHI